MYVRGELCLESAESPLHMSATDQKNTGPVPLAGDFDESPRTPAELVHHRTPLWKRMFDIAGSVILIVAFSPILLAIALYVRIVSGAPVTFRQSRLGEMGEYFTIFKFRTLETEKGSTSVHRNYVAGLQDSDASSGQARFW